MVVRGEVRRLSRARVRRRRRVPARLAQRQRPDGRFPASRRRSSRRSRRPNAVLDGEVCRLDPSGRASFSELQQGAGHLVYYVFDLLEARRRSRSSTFRCTSGGPGCAALLDARNPHGRAAPEDFADGDALFACRRRAGPRRRDREARLSRTYLPGRRTREWVKVKAANTRRVRHRRLHARGGPARRHVRLACARRVRRRRAALRRQCRHRASTTPRSASCDAARAAPPCRPSPFRVDPEAAACPAGRRAVGRAASRRAGALSASGRTTATCATPRTSACATTRPPRTWSPRRPTARATAVTRRRGAAGPARATPLEPRQAVLARRRDHEGRPARATTRRSRRSCVPHLSDRPFTMRRYPRRRLRQGVLPEGRAAAHAGVDPDASRAHVSAATARRRGGSISAGRRRARRCSGW